MKPTANLPSSSATRWPRWRKPALICAACIWGLTSCATGSKATVAPPPPPPPPPIPASLRTPCPPLPLPASDAALALIANHDEVTVLYRSCKDNQAALSAALDDWQATARRWYCAAATAAGLRAGTCAGEGH